jgi:hypothetical protein
MDTSLVVVAGSLITSVAAVTGLLFERRARRRDIAFVRSGAVERARALVVIDDHRVAVEDGFHTITADVLNAGPAVARDIDLCVAESTESMIYFPVAETDVVRALTAGDRRTVTLAVPSEVARSKDLDMYLSWVDGNGAHNERVMIFLQGDEEHGIPINDWAAGIEPWSSVPSE